MQIRVNDVHFAYPGGVTALQGVSLTLQAGENVALVGGNGSGKTTLARHLNGLLRPQAGRVWVGGWRTDQHSPAKLAARVGYAFQNPDEQLFQRKVWDEVAFGPRNLGYPAQQVASLVERALALLELEPLAQANPRDLGYSTRKRVALAAVVAMQTPVLVLDEPTAGLDAHELNRLSRLIGALHGQGCTVLTISHDMDFIAETCDRVLLMGGGKIALDAPTAQFFGQPARLDACGLISPQMARLSQRLGHAQPALTVEQFLEGQERRGGNSRLP